MHASTTALGRCADAAHDFVASATCRIASDCAVVDGRSEQPTDLALPQSAEWDEWKPIRDL